MFDDFESAFTAALDSYEAFALLALAFGRVKLFVEGDVAAYEVQEYLEHNGIKADCWQMSDGVVVAIAGADASRARQLLENWR
jgi:hypothetical protein